MNFDSYIVKNVEIAQTVPLSCPPPQKLASNKGFGLFRRHTNRAFTLAETLITLTIIGVIAAMTIPTLVSKYQKHSYVTGLKKAYSTISNVMSLAMHDDEVLEYYSNGCIDFYNSWPNIIKKYMKIVKTCDESNWEECTVLDNYGEPKMAAGNDKIYITADGMTWSDYAVTVDVNGKKGPNKWGRDIFAFSIYPDCASSSVGITIATGTVIPYGSNYDKNSPLCTTEIVNRDEIEGARWTQAVYCAGRVLEEGAMNY